MYCMNGFVFAQHLLPQHFLSRVLGKIADSQWPTLKNFLIRRFVQKYQVDLSCAEYAMPEAYPSFNAFFTRALRPDARPIAPLQNSIISPVDGCISQMGHIRQGQILQAKGRQFTVNALLANHPQAASFQDGAFATLYLAPKDYHRIHMPIEGTLTAMQHVPGRLFSVNAMTALHVSNLFARNERVNCFFDTALGPVAVILVGAMIVASIETVWAGTVTPNSLTPPKIHLAKGAEMGRFKLGSTVIVLFPPRRICWERDLSAGAAVKMGQLLGSMTV